MCANSVDYIFIFMDFHKTCSVYQLFSLPLYSTMIQLYQWNGNRFY